jgi:hypothetical protein
VKKLAEYRKSITALFTGIVGWAGFVIASAPTEITAPEWLMLATAVGIALGVYAMPNGETAPIVQHIYPAAPAKKPPAVKKAAR